MVLLSIFKIKKYIYIQENTHEKKTKKYHSSLLVKDQNVK